LRSAALADYAAMKMIAMGRLSCSDIWSVACRHVNRADKNSQAKLELSAN